MYTERLLKLAEVLENFETERHNLVMPVDKFTIKRWYRKRPIFAYTDCGSAACAIGMAALHPWFIERQFHLEGGLWWDEADYSPRFGHASNPVTSVTAFFNIDRDEMEFLFMPDGYKGDFSASEPVEPTPADVAHRIRCFVHYGGIPK